MLETAAFITLAVIGILTALVVMWWERRHRDDDRPDDQA